MYTYSILYIILYYIILYYWLHLLGNPMSDLGDHTHDYTSILSRFWDEAFI